MSPQVTNFVSLSQIDEANYSIEGLETKDSEDGCMRAKGSAMAVPETKKGDSRSRARIQHVYAMHLTATERDLSINLFHSRSVGLCIALILQLLKIDLNTVRFTSYTVKEREEVHSISVLVVGILIFSRSLSPARKLSRNNYPVSNILESQICEAPKAVTPQFARVA